MKMRNVGVSVCFFFLAGIGAALGQRIDFAPGSGGGGGGSGTVTSVGLSDPGGIFSTVGTNPVMVSGTFGYATTGTSGGVPFFSSGTELQSSGELTAGMPMLGGGAASPPTVGTISGNTTTFVTTTGTQTASRCVEIDANGNHVAAADPCGTGSGGVTSVGMSVPASSIFGVSGSPVTGSGTIALSTTGTSGGIPYFSDNSTVASSAVMGVGKLIVGGGAGATPTALSNGTSTTLLHGNAGGSPTWSAVDLAADVTGILPSANGGAGGLAGLVLGNGASAPTAYGGTSCTNQFLRSLSTAGAATCASVANTDLVNSTITLNAGSNVGITAPGAMTLGSTYTFGSTSDTPRFAGLGLGGAAAGGNSLKVYGSSSGSIVFAVPAAAGSNTLTFPAGTTDFSSTGGTSQVVKQTSSGGALTVARLACSDLSDSASGCSTASPTVKGVAAVGWIATSNPDKVVVFTAAQSMTITDIRGTVDTAVGATATISVFKASSGTACSSGTNLVASAGTFDANGTANTNQTLTLAGSGAPSLTTGDRVCLSTSNGTNFFAGTGIGGITVTYTVP